MALVQSERPYRAFSRARGRKKSSTVGQSLPKSSKKRRTIVPPPQSQRIMERYVAGQSIREISREEGRARETTTKIVRSDQMQTFVLRMREQFYGLAYDALEAVQHALRQEKDGHLGYRFLTDIGVVPSKEERQTLTAHPVAAQKSEAEGVFEILKQMEEAAKERAELFGMSMPEKVVFEDVCRWLFETTGGIEPLIGFSEQTTENG